MVRGCLFTIFVQPFLIIGQIIWGLIQLIPYALVVGLIWFAFNNSGIGNLSVGSFSSWTTPLGERLRPLFDQEPAILPPAPLHDRYLLDFRFRWQGDEIYYLGNQIEDHYFVQLAEEADRLGGKVTVERTRDVEQALIDQRLDVLTELGVPYEIRG